MTKPGSAAITRLAQVSTRFWPALDGMRGLSILLVLAHNTWFVPGVVAHSHAQENLAAWITERLIGEVTGPGWIGVELFFVLSGFLITGILLRLRGSSRALFRFAMRRALRIMPPYLVVLAVVWLGLPHLVPAMHKSGLVWYLVYLQNWWSPLAHAGTGPLGHTWSLAVEEQFYLLWPFVVLLLSPRRIRDVCLAAIVAAPLIRIWLHAHAMPEAAYEFTIARMDGLAGGALLALLVTSEAGAARLARVDLRWAAALPLAGIALVYAREHQLAPYLPWSAVIGQSGVMLLSVVLVLATAESVTRAGGPGPLARVLEWGPLHRLGRLSYGVYLVHLPLSWVLNPAASRLLSPLAGFAGITLHVGYIVLLAVLSVLLAWVLHRAVERPILAWRDRTFPA